VKDRIEELAFITTGRVAGNKNVSAVEKMISETITLAVNEALELAAKECDKLAWSNKNTAMLGPENNCVRCAEAIRKLKVKE
jgi:hypothetical protein